MKNLNTVSSKLTAFAAALAMNGLVLGALGYLFALQSHPKHVSDFFREGSHREPGVQLVLRLLRFLFYSPPTKVPLI